MFDDQPSCSELESQTLWEVRGASLHTWAHGWVQGADLGLSTDLGSTFCSISPSGLTPPLSHPVTPDPVNHNVLQQLE